ncbi:exodeoxyribonuclease V subunit beta [unidentified bacterial endosymbiont]|uniref:exodeoxyribonuclease V subunit beta n=1 Tax=unidentified bacterial endosymbiont TaxID=2355 RepID=UPI0020A19744|nr:exodeoxyribonuclease V subunit beta [unidentified bacterial endosymbiont]
MNVTLHNDPLWLPLQGQHLIEASAGTGKTFTLVTLYLRLLLGLDTPLRSPLRVDQILVVTFTEAATQELRERLRRRIRALQQCCQQGPGEDEALNQLLAAIEQPPVAAAWLLAAERQLDEAAIMTIHAFCQRMLIQQAIEARTLLSHALVTNDDADQQQAVADFWRRHFYPLPAALARVIQQQWSGPQALLSELAPYLSGDLPQLLLHPPVNERIMARHQRLIETISTVKQQWRQLEEPVDALLNQVALNKRRYPARYLTQWIQQIDTWAQQATEDYQLPEALPRFRYTILSSATLQGEPPQHPLFKAIEQLCTLPLTIHDLVIAQALPEIRQAIANSKQQRAEVAFDDLLSQLDQALQQNCGANLAAAIRQRYPAALIDEFQDTDPLQYRIFRRLYDEQPETLLILIGDPKQAIYAFRGADIFTYIQARRTIHRHYTLQTNWRSSSLLVLAVNRLFQQAKAPFIFDQDIPFVPLHTPDSADQTHWSVRGERQPPLQFYYSTEMMTLQQYGETMAAACAAQISDWLAAGQQQQALLLQGTHSRAVTAGDMAVLVRTSDEARLIRQALTALAIPSVYLSERQSVFATLEAAELLRLLEALAYPLQPESLLAVLAGSLLMLDAVALEQWHQDDQRWEETLNEFTEYQQLWRQQGVLPMLQRLMFRHQLPEKLLTLPEGERRLTDLRHLGELLQEAAQRLESPQALVRWFSQQINQPNRGVESQQLRLENDRHLVKIITIHKAKGLEYPLVWIPFPAAFRQTKTAYYHDRHSHRAILDLCGSPQALQWAAEEQLAESVRLLYVALTRAIFHCSVGIAPVISGRARASATTDLHRSAIGYLLQRGEACEAQQLQQALEALQGPEIAMVPLATLPSAIPLKATTDSALLSARSFNRSFTPIWRITSYSALQRQAQVTVEEATPSTQQPLLSSLPPSVLLAETPGVLESHHFPRGSSAGIFLHHLLQHLDFTAPLQPAWLLEQLTQQGFDPQWYSLLEQWLPSILQTPLNDQGLCLQQLKAEHKQCELHFYLPIEGVLHCSALEALMRRYDPLSQQASALSFQQVHGMLQGFIDLVFVWQGRYYLLDYKSNWLGETIEAYRPAAMATALCHHRYDLQYQFYTLALHRYLRYCLPDYQYETHFGGVFYLFLRGMTGQQDDHGVFFHRPAMALISSLDAWFANRGTKDVNTIKTG